MSAQPIRLDIQQSINPQPPRLVALNLPQQHPPPVKLQLGPAQTPVKLQVGSRKPTQTPAQLQVGANPTQAEAYHINASEYQTYDDPRDHIYDLTDSYIGSDEQMPRSERVLNLDSMTFQEEEVTIPEGVENIYVEISSNAGDNVARSIRHGVNPGEVTIVMTKEIMSVRNGGIAIPIEIHPTKKMWAPQLIFGILHSSINYDKNKEGKIRTECGRNGYGAKLTNIFSKEFMVTIGDDHNKR